MRAERPSKPQQNDLGMESNALTALDVATIPGAGCKMAGPRDSLGTRAMRAVSFFRPVWIKFSDAGGTAALLRSGLVATSNGVGEGPAGFGRGCKTGEREGCRRNPGGRRKVISGLWGSATGTVSFFGSAMTNQVAPRKITENSLIVTP